MVENRLAEGFFCLQNALEYFCSLFWLMVCILLRHDLLFSLSSLFSCLEPISHFIRGPMSRAPLQRRFHVVRIGRCMVLYGLGWNYEVIRIGNVSDVPHTNFEAGPRMSPEVPYTKRTDAPMISNPRSSRVLRWHESGRDYQNVRWDFLKRLHGKLKRMKLGRKAESHQALHTQYPDRLYVLSWWPEG